MSTKFASEAGRLLGLDEAAEYLADTPRHVRSLWERGELGGYKIGRKVRFRVSDLDEFIERQRVPAMFSARRKESA